MKLCHLLIIFHPSQTLPAEPFPPSSVLTRRATHRWVNKLLHSYPHFKPECLFYSFVHHFFVYSFMLCFNKQLAYQPSRLYKHCTYQGETWGRANLTWTLKKPPICNFLKSMSSIFTIMSQDTTYTAQVKWHLSHAYVHPRLSLLSFWEISLLKR